ncbi:hypothetical protein HF313_00170 [Massilia atriviolacea]|uniref:Uncharacterized protein n=1 Tax=Massilia atriviolacea TaxID=2495579 RepID=A0A430HKY2_9BURK|nr:hypothetical protein [Massilia atriviolacea]RSZ58160.1 hypothetical protein EJB06_14400 [Massilia atriviolacea]
MATFPGASIAWAALALSSGMATAQPRFPDDPARFGSADSAWLSEPPRYTTGAAAAIARPLGLGRDMRLSTSAWWGMASGYDSNYAVGGLTVMLGAEPGSGAPFDMARLLARRALDTPLPSSSPCVVPWLQCAAFGSVEARMREQHAFLNGRQAGDEALAGRRNVVRALSAGMRFHFPYTRSAQHGPWFVQLRVSRRSPEFRSSLPRPRRAGVSLTIGTEF